MKNGVKNIQTAGYNGACTVRIGATTKGQTKSKCFFQKTNKQIQLYYYETAGRHVFVRFLEEIEDTKRTFRN